MTSSNLLFCPQPKDIQLTVIEEERTQKILTVKKLQRREFSLFPTDYSDQSVRLSEEFSVDLIVES